MGADVPGGSGVGADVPGRPGVGVDVPGGLGNTMILIMILSDATYNFEIHFVAIIHY